MAMLKMKILQSIKYTYLLTSCSCGFSSKPALPNSKTNPKRTKTHRPKDAHMGAVHEYSRTYV